MAVPCCVLEDEELKPCQVEFAILRAVPDPDVVVPAVHGLALMEAERIRSGKFTG